MRRSASGERLPQVRERFSAKINALQEAIERDKLDIQKLNHKASDEQFLKDEDTQHKLKDLLEKIDLQKDDYLFRSSINQLLIRFVERIELRQPSEEINPWEFDEQSADVAQFRKHSSVKALLPIEEIVTSNEFAQFCKKQRRQISVFYKSGAVRHILWGENAW